VTDISFLEQMSSRQGGKLKPLKVMPVHPHISSIAEADLQAPKKEKAEETEEEKVFKEKKKAEATAQKEALKKGTR
jgi:hypothetical protein